MYQNQKVIRILKGEEEKVWIVFKDRNLNF